MWHTAIKTLFALVLCAGIASAQYYPGPGGAGGGCSAIGSPIMNIILMDNGSGCPADATSAATIPGLAIVSGGLNFQGNISQAAWTTNGLRLTSTPATLTDTSSSGTVAAAYTNVLGGNTIAATMATTYTNYFNTYINAPVAGSNVTFTNKFALGVDSLYSAGNVGIGTTSPSGALVVQPVSDSTTAVQFLKNDGTSVLDVDTTNKRVGIGNNNPLGPLQINGNSSYGQLALSRAAGVAISGGFGISNSTGQVITGDKQGDFGLFVTGGNLNFSANNGATLQMVLLTSGNVGIGTASPGAPLTVAVNALGTTTATSALLQNTTASTSGATVQITPSLRFDGHAWNTTATAADNNVRGRMYLLPVSGATPSGIWHWQGSVDTGTPSFSDSMTLTTGGVLQPLGGYAAADGTAGATVTTCTAFKNGLCVSGT